MTLPGNARTDILESGDDSLYEVRTSAAGPQGSLPLTPEMLLDRPSGDIFGLSQDAGMGWEPSQLGGNEVLILSTQGGIRAD
ncbi:MAG: Dihydroxy-acid dehydratase, partial [Chloroflexi bacterium]|nr:Dihydroxy-acid dehydratase [Chloroflexota bacterium]